MAAKKRLRRLYKFTRGPRGGKKFKGHGKEPHKRACLHCGKVHSASQHRSHGVGSFLMTHKPRASRLPMGPIGR